MKKVTIETNYNVIKEVAKELGINYVGIKKEVLVEQVNTKIDSLAPKKGGKWYEQENAFSFTEGSLAIITNHKNKAIMGRMVQITGPSSKRNAVKCHLISPKDGAHQKTALSLDFDMITEYIPQYPVVTPPASLMVI